jgi:enoyl-CoA hydratase/carnithine racemase
VEPAPLGIDRSTDGSQVFLRLPGGALSVSSAGRLAAAAHRLTEDRHVRVVVLTADGPDFCTGPADDLDPAGLGDDPAAALARIRVPVVAAVRGACRSVGLELVLACDIVVADDNARFALDDVIDGARLPCWGGTQRLPRAVGGARAAGMLLLGEALGAEDARRAGLVWQTVTAHGDRDTLGDQVIALATKLCGLGPLALEYAKEAVHRGAELPLRDGLRLEGDLNTLLATSADRAEGLAAFFAKRPADFAGR